MRPKYWSKVLGTGYEVRRSWCDASCGIRATGVELKPGLVFEGERIPFITLHCPTPIVSGALDRHTTPPETKRIFDAASHPKELWIVDGAAHVDLHAFTPQAYEARVGAFLAKYLRTPG